MRLCRVENFSQRKKGLSVNTKACYMTWNFFQCAVIRSSGEKYLDQNDCNAHLLAAQEPQAMTAAPGSPISIC